MLQQVTETFDVGRGPELNLFWLEAVKRSGNQRWDPGILVELRDSEVGSYGQGRILRWCHQQEKWSFLGEFVQSSKKMRQRDRMETFAHLLWQRMFALGRVEKR